MSWAPFLSVFSVHVPLTVFLTLNPSVPTVVSVPVGDPVKLHCYADINRQTEDSQLDVRWKKEGKLVLHLHSGLVTQGSGFKNRVDVSKEDIRKGDLSLILNDTRLSDQGHYQCFYNDLTGCLGRVTLNIAGGILFESLVVPYFLFSSSPVCRNSNV
uniref:Ig-like domain-containing protein n=1 Tax=Scleropages formosus TaxID=113540 RepID=A0A8C9V2K2_SCLFO